MVQCHELHAETDSERGVLGLIECFEELDFEGLAGGLHECDLGVEWFAEWVGVGIVAAGEDEPVANVEIVGDGVGVVGENEGNGTGLRDGVDVGGLKHIAPAGGLGRGGILYGISGDTDDRWAMGHSGLAGKSVGGFVVGAIFVFGRVICGLCVGFFVGCIGVGFGVGCGGFVDGLFNFVVLLSDFIFDV